MGWCDCAGVTAGVTVLVWCGMVCDYAGVTVLVWCGLVWWVIMSVV